jgi:hypothetical protein
MSSHTYHEDTHEFGLADDCPRCEEHAEHPFDSLDSENILALLDRIENNLPARSDNEARAMQKMALHMAHERHLQELRKET